MAEDTLITAIEEDARAQVHRILEEAREAAEAILRQASIEAEQEKEERRRELEQRLKGEKAAILNSALTRASGKKLAVRLELIDRVLLEAEKRFSTLPKEDYSKLIGQLFSELKKEWEKERPGEVPVVFVNPADREFLETDLEVREDGRVRLGVVFVSEDETIRFENTIPARMKKGRAVMVPAINEMLFDEVFS